MIRSSFLKVNAIQQTNPKFNQMLNSIIGILLFYLNSLKMKLIKKQSNSGSKEDITLRGQKTMMSTVNMVTMETMAKRKWNEIRSV